MRQSAFLRGSVPGQRIGSTQDVPMHEPRKRPDDPAIRGKRRPREIEIAQRGDGHCRQQGDACSRESRPGQPPRQHERQRSGRGHPGEDGVHLVGAGQLAHELHTAGGEPPHNAPAEQQGNKAAFPGGKHLARAVGNTRRHNA